MSRITKLLNCSAFDYDYYLFMTLILRTNPIKQYTVLRIPNCTYIS